MRTPQQLIPGSLPLNEVTFGGHPLLRVETSIGPRLHLVPPASLYPGTAGRPAGWIPPEGYDRRQVRDARWTPRTMCGLRWSAMATHAAEIARAAAGDDDPARGDYVCPACAFYALTELP